MANGYAITPHVVSRASIVSTIVDVVSNDEAHKGTARGLIDLIIEDVRMTTSAAAIPLLDNSPSRMLSTDGAAHDTASEVVAIVDAVDANSVQEGNHLPRVIVIPQVLVLYVTFEDWAGLDKSLWTDIVVSKSPDKARKALLVLLDFVEDSILCVNGSSQIPMVTSTLKLQRLTVEAKGWHVSQVTNVDDDVGLDVVDELAEPGKPVVVEVGVGMTVADDKVSLTQEVSSVTASRAWVSSF